MNQYFLNFKAEKHNSNLNLDNLIFKKVISQNRTENSGKGSNWDRKFFKIFRYALNLIQLKSQ